MDHVEQVYWALGFVATGGLALFGFLWKHSTNDKRHVSNGMSKYEIGADFRTLGAQIESVKEVLMDFREEQRDNCKAQCNSIRDQLDDMRNHYEGE